jgi:hypothetical protein
MGTSSAAKIRLNVRTKKAIRERKADEAFSSLMQHKISGVRNLVSDPSSYASLAALLQLVSTPKLHVAAKNLGIPKLSDTPGSQVVGALAGVALAAATPFGSNMVASLVARAATAAFLELAGARKLTPDKLTTEAIEKSLSLATRDRVVSLFFENLLGSFVEFNIGRAVGEYTTESGPFTSLAQGDEFEEQVRKGTELQARKIASAILKGLGDKGIDDISRTKLKSILRKAANRALKEDEPPG